MVAKETKMKKQKTSMYMAAGLFVLLIVFGVLGPMYGQLQQSGGPGTAVTASQGGAWNVAPKTACGGTAFTPAWQVVPTANTALTATTSCVIAILITNTNPSAQTVTITDGQGTPVTVLSAFSIPGNSQVTLPLHGAQMTTGIKWSAGGTGLTGTVVAYQ
jgi:hypothetical protein